MRHRFLAAVAVAAGVALPGPAAAAPPPATSHVKAATVTPTVAGLKYQVRQFGRYRTGRVLEIAAQYEDGISGDLALGLFSRETGLRNIVGGGFFDELGQFQVTGTDRGLGQINDVFHRPFLLSIPGCDSGSYKETHLSQPEGGRGAEPRGRVPGLTRGLRYTILLLQRGVAYATAQGVPAADAVRVAVAGYNSGMFNAVRGYREGQPDRYTTGGDYSRDVLERRSKIRRARRSLGWK